MGYLPDLPHSKKRGNITPERRAALLARNEQAYADGEFLTQKQLALEFDIVQCRVSQILREEGARTRTRSEASPTKLDVEAAIRTYLGDKKLRLSDIAALYDSTWAAVRNQFDKAGVLMRQAEDYPTYTECNRRFFSDVDPVRAYFAGHIAADGCVANSGLAILYGIHPEDIEILENLKTAATLDQPIIQRANNHNRVYSWLNVCSKDWVLDLKKHYNIVARKSLILEPPNLTDEALVWHFIRGYFDGDGHASTRGHISFISASPKMFDWLISWCGDPDYIQTQRWLDETRNEYHEARSAWYCAGRQRNAIADLGRKLYQGASPEIYLHRKYDRLQARHGDLTG